MAGYHDIGKTLISPYLINREEGTLFGIGRGTRIDFEKELSVLRLSHVIAGMRLLRLYKEYIDPEEYLLMRMVIGCHHVAYDGIGTASAPSYPDRIGMEEVGNFIINKNGTVKTNQFPDIVKIIRTADVYCAALENRFYLSESERLVALAKTEGISPEDAAAGLTITVAGTDVDPKMAACLLTAMYDVNFEKAEQIVRKLSCRDAKLLRKRGKDVEWTLAEVIRRRRFLHLIEKKRSGWKKRVDTGLFLLADVFA
jgi:hypothetical protein